MPPVAEETTEIGAATESKDTTEIKETNTERVTEPFREVDGAFDETDGDPIRGGTICIIADTVACNDCHSRGQPAISWRASGVHQISLSASAERAFANFRDKKHRILQLQIFATKTSFLHIFALTALRLR